MTRLEIIQALLEGSRLRLRLLKEEHDREMKAREKLDAGYWEGRFSEVHRVISSLEKELENSHNDHRSGAI